MAGETECRPVKDAGEPCAGEPHARIEVAAGGDQASRASTCRAAREPLADPTSGSHGGRLQQDGLPLHGPLAIGSARQAARRRIRELTDRRPLMLAIEDVVANLNRFLIGCGGYFRYGN